MQSHIRTFVNNYYSLEWWYRTAFPFAKREFKKWMSQMMYNPGEMPTSIMSEDWDSLVLLDACRYDLFQEETDAGEELGFRISVGSATPEFLTKSFKNNTFLDTVYVTANPMYRTLDLGETFHQIVDVWQDDWDEELQTVRPEAMVQSTMNAHREYPNKRIIAHFMQPHYPFIGELSDAIGEHSGFEYSYRKATGKIASRDNPTVWELLERGDVSRDLVWKAYRENLAIALDVVNEMVENIDGKTVITSDHGNALGERPFPLAKRMYGHPVGYRHDSLCKVPWLAQTRGERREIIEGSAGADYAGDAGVVKDRLSDLGYV